MKRRSLLRSVAFLPLAFGGLPVIRAFTETAMAKSARANRRIRPADPSWPSEAAWTKLKDDVGGQLINVRPLFGPCATAPNGAECQEALKYIGNPYWIGDQPAGTEVSGWLNAWAPAPSVYAIKARDATDVAAGVKFALEHNLRLVIKGGGHSYLGTSNAPDSLLIWTRAMNKVTLHDAFVGAGCERRIAPVAAVSAEAGAVWMDLYNAVTTGAGRYVQGGGCTTVGVAGLVQSGGFGSFSKGFGTAASGLIEAEVVTADGRVRVVNECTDPDLYWAIKGGGGGTYGIVTRLTLRTHDLPHFFGYASGRIKARSDAAFAELITRFIGWYREHLLNPHWGEQVNFGPDNILGISMVSQGLDSRQTLDAWQSFFDWVQEQPKKFAVLSPLRAGAENPRTWWSIDGNPSMTRDAREGAPANRGWWKGDQAQVGGFIHGYDSLWLPASLLRVDRQEMLAAALLAASRHKQVQLHFNKGLAGAPPAVLAAARRTATNPEVTDAFALAIIAAGERPSYPDLMRPAMDLNAAHQDAQEIDLAAWELRKAAPNAGSYVSESNYFNHDWQRAYWGSNYPKLRAIKAAYDPEGLFFVYHGVGSEDWSADGFTRLVP